MKLLDKYKAWKFKRQVAKAPKNLEEALTFLRKTLAKEVLDQIKNEPKSLHFSLGMCLRNQWGLWYSDISVLAQYFNGLGIYHADDMSGIILESLRRQLNQYPIDLDGQVEYYKEYWRKNGKES